jgi:ribosomal protein S12 methylthiotransferase
MVDKIVVMGCLVQRFKEQLQLEIPEVDRFYGVDELALILEDLGADYRKDLLGERMQVTPKHYAYLKIAEGCDRKCAFCTIPEIRGANKSKTIEAIAAEARYLASQGVKELILIAQDTTRYGVDIYGESRLPELLRELDKTEGIRWIRLQYTYPNKVLYNVLEVMKDSVKICHYLDIPLQHVSDKILKSMKRGHTGKIIRELLDAYRREIPDMAIRTTMISGYPGEGEQEFEELKAFIRNYRFERLGVFAFSPEEGTAAAELDDDVPTVEKNRRADEIMELQKQVSASLNADKVGEQMLLVADRFENDIWVCRSQYDSPEVDTEIYVKDNEAIYQGRFFNAVITEADDYDLYGEFVEVV